VIVRVVRVRVKATKVGAFNAVFRAQVQLLKAQPGLVYVKLARRLQSDGGEEVVLFEEWEDAASLYAWAGSDLTAPRLVEGARELAEDISVAHYEALDKHTDDAATQLTHAHQEDERAVEASRDDGPSGDGSSGD
jgi:heme-degrading monooxygenase HmoA